MKSATVSLTRFGIGSFQRSYGKRLRLNSFFIENPATKVHLRACKAQSLTERSRLSEFTCLCKHRLAQKGKASAFEGWNAVSVQPGVEGDHVLRFKLLESCQLLVNLPAEVVVHRLHLLRRPRIGHRYGRDHTLQPVLEHRRVSQPIRDGFLLGLHQRVLHGFQAIHQGLEDLRGFPLCIVVALASGQFRELTLDPAQAVESVVGF